MDEKQGETKTLMFNGSVQDAAHRAGFVASRSYTFSLRALFKSHLSEDAPSALHHSAPPCRPGGPGKTVWAECVFATPT
ncbi:hypothetical protein [Streptomyces violarus]|uniref:hypothetical protein n=1 Tax=Streptomyces violarus TaxID=67380 RepID=UPI0021BF3F8F|nr:hypothetical protein [Streptomyces violarus]MCT9145234.1 hypothetical protein [Streptomyces violarus]